MSTTQTATPPVLHADQFFIGGKWVAPSTNATIDVIDSGTEEVYYRIAEAAPDDMARAVAAARTAFDEGPWARLTHAERAEYIRALGAGLEQRTDVLGQLWPRESGALYAFAQYAGMIGSRALEPYAALADTFPFEEQCPPTSGGEFGLLVREPVGVVGAIIPWNAPMALICHKIGPALLAGCTVVLKSSPEAPGEGNVVAEVAEQIGLPPGVLNVLTADREVSELLVRNPDVDKITFTGSTVAGRRIASLCGERIARCTLELGGKSAAIILDDMDLGVAAKTLARAECAISGQVCSSLTRIVVTKGRHDELVDALAGAFSKVRVGDPFDEQTQMGPLVADRQRERVEGYIAKGVAEGATLATGGGRPKDLDRGFYVEPTVFGNVDNSSTIAQEEIFGPVLSVIPAANEQDAIRIANDTIYGLNASVFTNDVERARSVASELRSGTVGHNHFRTDFGMSFGGFKQSGIGREGGKEGLLPFLETKTVILEGTPEAYTTEADVRLSVSLPTFAAEDPGGWDRVFDVARAADEVGVDRVVVSDHVVFGENLEAYARPETGGVEGGQQPTGPDGHWLEPLTVLTAVAAQTSRLRLGTYILIAALRRPVVLAKQVATLDVLSRGRVDLGVGIGWQREEYEAAGLDFGARGRLLDQTLEVCQTLWRDQRASFDSPELRFDAIHAMPKPTQDGGVPIWVSGRCNDRVAKRPARFGKGWIPWGEDAADLASSVPRMRTAVDVAGGDGAAIAVLGTVAVPRDDDRAIDIAKLSDRLARVTEIGVDDVLVHGRAPASYEAALDAYGEIVTALAKATGR